MNSCVYRDESSPSRAFSHPNWGVEDEPVKSNNENLTFRQRDGRSRILIN